MNADHNDRADSIHADGEPAFIIGALIATAALWLLILHLVCHAH